MYVDYLNLTVPETVAATVVDEVNEVLDYCGARQLSHETYRLGDRGSVKIRKLYGYTLVSLSGGALDKLRETDQLAPFLWIFAAQPHRVTWRRSGSCRLGHDRGYSTAVDAERGEFEGIGCWNRRGWTLRALVRLHLP